MGRSAALSRERIVGEALALLDEEGVAGLTMRRLAARLGVKAASLYHHVQGHDDLIDAMHEEINRDIDTSLLDDRTPAGLTAFSHSYRDAYLRHPDAVDLVSRRSVTAPKALEVYDAIAAHLTARGLAASDLMPVLAVLDFVVLGSAGETLAADFHRDPDSYTAHHPHLAAALRAADPATVDDTAFEIALESCLASIERRVES
jgi:AcrR family transcriptional regulator